MSGREWKDARVCETCGQTGCPGAPALKGFCRFDPCAPYARVPSPDPRIDLREAPLEFERCKLEPGQRRKLATRRPRILYRGLRLRFDPLSRDVFVHALEVDGQPLNHILGGPTSAVVLTTSKLWISTLDASQRYVLDVEYLGKDVLDLATWVEGIWVE